MYNLFIRIGLVVLLLSPSLNGYVINNHYDLTGSSGQNDGSPNLRFSSGYDNTFRVFDVDVSNVSECKDLCNTYDHCIGIFYIENNTGMTLTSPKCIGLSYLGNIEASFDISESYTRIQHHIFVENNYTVYGYIQNENELNNKYFAYIDFNHNGKYDIEEPHTYPNVNGLFLFENLQPSFYVFKINYNRPCFQIFPNYDGIIYSDLNNTLFPHTEIPNQLIEYYNSGGGIHPGIYGGDININTNQPAVHQMFNIDPSILLSNNTNEFIVLTNNSYIILSFENLLISKTSNGNLTVKVPSNLVAFGGELEILVSHDGITYYTIDIISITNPICNLGNSPIEIIKNIKIKTRSVNIYVDGFPIILVSINTTEVDRIPFSYILFNYLHWKIDNTFVINFDATCGYVYQCGEQCSVIYNGYLDNIKQCVLGCDLYANFSYCDSCDSNIFCMEGCYYQLESEVYPYYYLEYHREYDRTDFDNHNVSNYKNMTCEFNNITLKSCINDIIDNCTIDYYCDFIIEYHHTNTTTNLTDLFFMFVSGNLTLVDYHHNEHFIHTYKKQFETTTTTTTTTTKINPQLPTTPVSSTSKDDNIDIVLILSIIISLIIFIIIIIAFITWYKRYNKRYNIRHENNRAVREQNNEFINPVYDVNDLTSYPDTELYRDRINNEEDPYIYETVSSNQNNNTGFYLEPDRIVETKEINDPSYLQIANNGSFIVKDENDYSHIVK